MEIYFSQCTGRVVGQCGVKNIILQAPPLHKQKSILNLVNSYQIWIVIALFRQIFQHQTEVLLILQYLKHNNTSAASARREIAPEPGLFKPKLDCSYSFSMDFLAPKGSPFAARNQSEKSNYNPVNDSKILLNKSLISEYGIYCSMLK